MKEIDEICNFDVGIDKPFFLIAGPDVIESKQLVMDVASQLKEITLKLHIPFIFKASFDKANRSSHKSFRGLGIETSLAILAEVKKTIGVPVLTDVHEDTPLNEVASVVDVYRPPHFYVVKRILFKMLQPAGCPLILKKASFYRPGK